MTHICVSKLTVIASDSGLSPGRRQAIIWNNDGILLIWPLATSFSKILIEIHSFSFKKMRHLKMSSGKWRPFCLDLSVLIYHKQKDICLILANWCSIYIDGLVQDCINSSALTMELLQFYAKPSTCSFGLETYHVLVVRWMTIFNSSRLRDAFMGLKPRPSLVQIMTCCLFCANGSLSSMRTWEPYFN